MGIVDGFEWKGLQNLSPNFLNGMLSDVKKSKDTEELSASLTALSRTLSSLSLFKELYFAVDASKTHSGMFDISCTAKELKRRLSIGSKITGTQNPKPTLSADASVYNFIVGWGERLTASCSLGLDEKEPWRVGLGVPLMNSLLTLQSSRTDSVYRPFVADGFNGFGSGDDVAFYSNNNNNNNNSNNNSNNNKYRADLLSLNWKDFMLALEDRVSQREDLSGRRLFLSKTFNNTINIFNLKNNNTQRQQPKTSTKVEVGVFEDGIKQPYLKVDGRLSFKKIIHSKFELSSAVAGSFLAGRCPLRNELLYMGGPTSLRGFHPLSVGPLDAVSGESCGSRMKLEGGISLCHPLSLSGFSGDSGGGLGGDSEKQGINNQSQLTQQNSPLNGHVFINAGIIGNRKEDMAASSSCGIGLILKIDEDKKIELNFAHPLLLGGGSCPQNFPVASFKDRISFGFGVDFLG